MFNYTNLTLEEATREIYYKISADVKHWHHSLYALCTAKQDVLEILKAQHEAGIHIGQQTTILKHWHQSNPPEDRDFLAYNKQNKKLWVLRHDPIKISYIIPGTNYYPVFTHWTDITTPDEPDASDHTLHTPE